MTSQSMRKWGLGLVGAAINSAATAVTLVIVDPVTFADWSRLWKVMAVNAVIGLALYLKQHPVPPDETES